METKNTKQSLHRRLMNFIFKVCPITGGNRTRMDKETFAVMCQSYKAGTAVITGSAGGKRCKSRFCEICPGVPAEVEFINKKEYAAMMKSHGRV